MSKALTLSIVIPAYNEENHLKACLESIAGQTVAPDEVIVVNNNSTDATAKVAKGYSFVKLINEKNQGIVHARDKGFNTARSKLIGRIDADTVLPPYWVARVKAMYKPEASREQALTGGGYFYNIRAPRIHGWLYGQIAFRMNRLIKGHYILWGANMAIPASVWRKVRAEVCQRNDIHEDLDLAIHLHRLDYKIIYHEDLRVGVKMRRVRSDRRKLWANLMLWPQTLRSHGFKGWIFGWLGAVILFLCVPVILLAEKTAVAAGRSSLKE